MKTEADVFFDFDMTLAYRILMWSATVRELLLENCVVTDDGAVRPFTVGNGYPWNRPDLSHEQFFGSKGWWQNSQDFIVEGLISGKVCGETVARKVADAFPSRYADLRYWRVFPDTVPALTELKNRGLRLHLLSNHVPEARQIVTGLKLEGYFESMTISAEVGWEKPNPRIFEIAAKNAKGRKIMVGDNYGCDVEGALACGFDAVFVRRENVYGIRRYAKTLWALPEVIENILTGSEERK